MRLLRTELRAVWAALIYFTRLRLSPLPNPQPDDWRRASSYFPLVGVFVGCFGAAVWVLASRVLPNPIACGLSMAATMLLTGAMHEDGFADLCDGFGGGNDREQILEIMKDSRVGAFGLMGGLMMLGMKWLALSSLGHAPLLLCGALVAAHALSRGAAISLMFSLGYARSEGKAKPLVSRLSWRRLTLILALSLAPLACLPLTFWWALLPLVALRYMFVAWFSKRLGGYTGDCLGCVQQVTEIAFLLCTVALA